MSELNDQRTATLHRKKGESFGFSLRRAIEDGANFRLAEGLPTLHKLIDVVEDGYAYKASLRNDDRLIEINGQDVKSKSYLECIQLIRNTGDIIALKVIRLSEDNVVSPLIQTFTTVTVEPNTEETISLINISDFLHSNHCIYSIKIDDNNNSSIIQCFEILRPHCQDPEDVLHITFNMIVDEPLDTNILYSILKHPTSPADGLTSYIVDSLKRYHSLNDIILTLSEVLSILDDNNIEKYEILINQLTKRMLLIQALESMSYDSQRFFCNFIRKNDLPIPLSYRIWNLIEKQMYYRINFNCLMETLCATNLRLLLQFGSPSTSGLGKTSLIGYIFDDKRRESFFTDAADCSWRDGCIDVIFANQFTVFDVHGKTLDMRLIRSIQLYAYVQIVYVTENDLQGDFLAKNILSNIQTIVVIFDSNYDNQPTSTQLIKRFEDKFKQLDNILWTTAPALNTHHNLPIHKIAQRNKRLRGTFNKLLKQIEENTKESLFRSCFQIQSSFYQINSNLTPIQLVFDVEKELDRLFSSLSDKTENLLLITPNSYQRSSTKILTDFSQELNIINEYHHFTMTLLTHRTYIELLIVEIYLEKWRNAYVPKLREEQELLRENASIILRQLKQAERDKTNTSDLREQYEILRKQLKEIDHRLMNVDLTFGLLCDELFALWDNIHEKYLNRDINKFKNDFDLVAKKLAELVHKGFALHVLRGRPLKSHSRLLRMCMENLNIKDSISVLTVVGEQSSAKSSLLNSTFGCNFRVSAGRCTIGLYLGLAYYKNITIMILDTEGLMSLEESGSIFDNQIVTMAVLSSNIVIVNHKGEISSSLEGLIGMSLYAKIQIQSSPFKPKLLFVLRDQAQRDMKIVQLQLNRLKDNIQTNGDFLRMSIDDELEMKDVILMPSAFTEDKNRDYDIIQKWRTETFPSEINKFRTIVYKLLETEQRINLRKNIGIYLYSKLTTNWKSIDDLGEGLLRCQSLYELSVQNELNSIAGGIILEKQNQLQIQGSQLIETLIQTNNEQINTNNNGLKPHIWVQQIVKQGIIDLNQLIDKYIQEAKIEYDEQTQQTYFTKIKKQDKNIEASIKTMQQYLYEQLETRVLDTALKSNHDYYREELSQIKQINENLEEYKQQLNQRVKQLKIEITNHLQAYKRNKDDIIKSILDVYTNIILTKTTINRRRTIYSICLPLDYSKYYQNIQQFDTIINKYIKEYIEDSTNRNSSFSILEPITPSLAYSNDEQNDRNVYRWFSNLIDRCQIEQIINFVFNELFSRINDRLDIAPLHLAYSDPKMIDELIEMIDFELQSSKIDMSHINRTFFIQDLIILMLYLSHEKTNKKFEEKHQELLNNTLKDLDQVQQNLLDQINEHEKFYKQAKFFRRILGKELIREIERLQRQNFIEHIRSIFYKLHFNNSINITRKIYFESILSSSLNPTNILKLIFDPNQYCLEHIHTTLENILKQLIHFYWSEISTQVTTCMLIMKDVVLNSTWTSTSRLHQQVLKEIIKIFPRFHASKTIEVANKIENSERFREYFENLQLYDGENDSILSEQLNKVKEEFSQTSEYYNTLLYQSVGCTSRCPGCGIKCELPAKMTLDEEHHHYSQYHLPMAFNGWPRDEQLHPHLSMCYQQWTNKTLFRGDNSFSTPEEFFSSEATDWYNDVKQKSQTGEACDERYPLVEHRRAWMAVRYKLLKEFELRDQETYHSGIYPMTIVSIPNDFELLWKSF